MPTATAALPSVVELALHDRDFVRLRNALKNWQPPDVAYLINGLPLEDQAVVFRILPRKLAAETFGYLTQGQQEKLLKAMAQDEVTVLLNDMPDDDRTLLLEEMPAAATKHTDVSELERLVLRVQERVLAQTGVEIAREAAIAHIIAYRPDLAG